MNCGSDVPELEYVPGSLERRYLLDKLLPMQILVDLALRISIACLFVAIAGITGAAEEEERSRISWEEMERLEGRELWSAINTMNLYEKVDLATLTPSQIVSFKHRLKNIYDTRAFTMLVRLRDEETIAWLLSQMKLGGGSADRAGRCLRASGQAWLLPRLESLVFLDPAAEPKIQMSDVVFMSVAENAFYVCCQIVERSPEFTPKFKVWFDMMSDLGWKFRGDKRESLKPWWEVNRERMTKGQFRELTIIPLWPQRTTPAGEMEDRFNRADFFDALASKFPTVRDTALKRIKNQWVVDLSDSELRQIAKTILTPFDYVSTTATEILAVRGGEGIALLKEFVANPDAAIRACAAMALLEHTKSTAAERKQYLRAIVGGLGYDKNEGAFLASNYLTQHPELVAEVMPFLKERVLDKGLSDVARTSTACYFGAWAKKDDAPFLQSMLSSAFPKRVRVAAADALCRLSHSDKIPDSVRKLADDPDIAALIKRYQQSDKP